MKTFVSILMMVIAVTFTANAQQNNNQKGAKNIPEFSVEQHTKLALKKMTLELDLNEQQQNQIKANSSIKKIVEIKSNQIKKKLSLPGS